MDRHAIPAPRSTSAAQQGGAAAPPPRSSSAAPLGGAVAPQIDAVVARIERQIVRMRAAQLAERLRGSADPLDQQLLAALDRWSAGDLA